MTSSQAPAIPGVDAEAGPIALRDLLIAFRESGYPAGSDVPLEVGLFSTSEETVRLTSVTAAPATVMTVVAQRMTLHRPDSATTGTTTSAMTIPPEGYLLLVPPSGDFLVADLLAAHSDTNGSCPCDSPSAPAAPSRSTSPWATPDPIS